MRSAGRPPGSATITKGVGFLPLLILIPFALLRSPEWRPRIAPAARRRWLLGSARLLAGRQCLARADVARGPDEPCVGEPIATRSSFNRPSSATPTRGITSEPFWYFVVNVIPVLWLPLTALLPWLVPKWRDALARARSADRIVAVVDRDRHSVFQFQLGQARRLCSACRACIRAGSAPRTPLNYRENYPFSAPFGGSQRPSPVFCAAAVAYLAVSADARSEIIAKYDLDPLVPLALIGCGFGRLRV